VAIFEEYQDVVGTFMECVRADRETHLGESGAPQRRQLMMEHRLDMVVRLTQQAKGGSQTRLVIH